MPSTAEVVERLLQHRALSGAPRPELEWLAARGEMMYLPAGGVLTAKNSGTVAGMFIVLSGHLSIYIDRGLGPQRVMEWRGGDITGMLPYSRLVAPPSDVTAEEPSEILKIDRAHMTALVRECEELTAILVHIMLDRARHFTTSDLQVEKMSSLGKLAAGLAHELNNPASAVVRSADALEFKLIDVEAAARAFGAVPLTPAQQSAVARARSKCLAAGGASFARSPLERADREERIVEWLERHAAETDAAGALADSAITEDALEELAKALTGDALRLALAWLVAECAAHQLVSEIKAASSRIYKLVAAVKGFTYMDQGISQKPVDVAQGLNDTLVVLAPKARTKSIAVTLDLEPGLPCVLGLGGGLNQVWANLVDNALDAAKSQVKVSARRQADHVVVRVEDDGGGIPPEVRQRMFDPFFTTKKPGEGSGLGLDTVRRLVQQHRGDIAVESQPGRTEFAVTLPIDPGKI